jgi:Phosphotransferase enzyme family
MTATSGMRMYKGFPASSGPIRVPLSSRRAALAGLALYSACRGPAVLAQRAAWAWVTLLGPHALIGRSVPWQPIDGDAWQALADHWRATIGRFDEVAGYVRSDQSRGGFAVLLLDRGHPVAFVKAHPGPSSSIQDEERAMRLAWLAAPTAFRVPAVMDGGRVGEWSYYAVQPLPTALHRAPVRPPLTAIVRDLDRVLAQLPRPMGTPAHWRPMHGDLTPWNLREVPGNALYLVDWEHAAWGPPGADEMLYRATASALDGTPVEHCGWYGEAIDFWSERIASRSGDARDKRLDRATLAALETMRGP